MTGKDFQSSGPGVDVTMTVELGSIWLTVGDRIAVAKAGSADWLTTNLGVAVSSGRDVGVREGGMYGFETGVCSIAFSIGFLLLVDDEGLVEHATRNSKTNKNSKTALCFIAIDYILAFLLPSQLQDRFQNIAGIYFRTTWAQMDGCVGKLAWRDGIP